MAIRDERRNWTQEARKFSSTIKDVLKPTFKEAKNIGITQEEWFYLVTHTADDIIIDEALFDKVWAKRENQ